MAAVTIDADGTAAVCNGPDYQGIRDTLSSEASPEVCTSCASYSGAF